jgi:hypothetical protein
LRPYSIAYILCDRKDYTTKKKGGDSNHFPGGEVAERCLAEAKASGVELGCGMYNAVLRAYLAETPERPEEVNRLFGEMQELQAGDEKCQLSH